MSARFDPATAIRRWKAKLGALTARGFTSPPFAALVLGPVVRVDPDGDDPGEELHDATNAALARAASTHRPS